VAKRGISWAVGLVVTIVVAIISFLILSFPLQLAGQKGIPFILQPGEKAMQTFPLNETECRLLCIRYKAGENVDPTKLKACEEKYHLGCYSLQPQQAAFITPTQKNLPFCQCSLKATPNDDSSNICYQIAAELFGDPKKVPVYNGYLTITIPNPLQKDCNQICYNFYKNQCDEKCNDALKAELENCVIVQ
jgi:hypothetical protein